MPNIIKRFNNPRITLVLGILVLVNLALFSLPALAGSRPKILASAPELAVPDMKGIYSPDYVYDFLTAIGPAGRHAFQMMHFTTDLVFPLLYGLLLFAMLCRLVSQQAGGNVHLPLLALLPVASDLAENFSLVMITAQYPAFHPRLTWLAQGFTLLKFGGLLATLTVIVILFSMSRKTVN